MTPEMKETVKKVWESEKSLIGWLTRAGDRPNGAKVQMAIISELEKLAARNGMPTGGMPTLGSEILAQQQEKLGRFGDKAFSMTEKQLAAVVRDFETYRK